MILRGCRVVFTSKCTGLSLKRLGDWLRHCCRQQHKNRVFDPESASEEGIAHTAATKSMQHLSHCFAARYLHRLSLFWLLVAG